MDLVAPFEKFVELTGLSEAGLDVVLAPDAAERAKLAQWADLADLPRFTATVTLKRLSPSRFSYKARFEAELVQPCGVTLEPVTTVLEQSFSRELHLVRGVRKRPEPVELAPGSGEDEAPEEVESPHYDVAGPVLEEFSLAIPAYPRAPGADFAPVEAEKPESPFAVLGQLKEKG